MKRLIILFGLVGLISSSLTAQNTMKRNTLTKEEQRVIIHKGTERAFTGEYTDLKVAGTYLCKWCDTPLYESADKFDSHCGWPSFDDEIDGAVEKHLDPDGSRTEIVCANCQGHLGHVFVGEGFTEKNTRHCVNSISLKFVAKDHEETGNTETAIFAGGCFWGVEHLFKKQEGVLDLAVGYIGGHVSNPTYKQICYENTGHAEAIQVKFNPDQVSFKELAKLFFEIHDPGQLNRQGPDVGDQYRSEVFYTTKNQERITLDLIRELESKGLKVVTKVTSASTFWVAEDYHQDYYAKTGGTPYCHVYTKRF
jgi:peptide methionine sulfoxide reductase msrA/msrB